MKRRLLALCAAALVASLSWAADAPSAGPERPAPGRLLPDAQLRPDSKIPTLQEVVGHGWGEDITSYTEMERYLQALAKAAPDRARLVPYGESYENRTLYYLVISSPENMRRREQIRADNLRLADPRKTTPEEARRIVARAPALVWLAHSIHGNETSSTEAAMLTAYHLLADRRRETQELLKQLVVLIDPLQNPDGRERFVNVFQETRGAFPNANPWSSEHVERWPGGRFNHYLFDMNRDWFLQSQRETQGKAAAYLHWQPQIYVDAHEMGRNNTYYFVPPADPVNPFRLPRQSEWLFRLGRHQAASFDRYGFAYTTREMFDAFYPGYGSEWPTLQGGLGILWEQAGVRGLVVDRDDETQLRLDQAVRHHYISSLATLEIAAQQREELLADFYDARARGVQLGREGPVRDFFLPPKRRPDRTARLASLLIHNGVDVRRVDRPLTITCTDIRANAKRKRTIPAGSYQVPVAQPTGRLVRVLLDRHVEMGEEFVQRQLQRNERRFPDEIYDVTAWSLPLAFDVDCLAAHGEQDVESRPWDGRAPAGEVVGGRARVAYLTAPDDAALKALASWLQQGLRVHVADRSLQLDGIEFPRGTLIVKTRDNPPNLYDVMRQSARQFGMKIRSASTGFVAEGAHLGGPYVHWVRPPKIVLVVDRPASYSVGHTWHLLDQALRYPTTRVPARNLGQLDLHAHNVVIFPHGGWGGAEAPSEAQIERIRQWVREGGVLILIKGAAAWAAGEKVNLLAAQVKKQPVADPGSPKTEDESKASAADSSKDDATEPPDPVPGAFLRASVFDEHWMTFGCGPILDVLFNGNVIFAPPSPAKARSLVTFADREHLVTSGFCWPKTAELLAGAAYAIDQPLGEGHVIALADDPNYRAMYPSLQRLFINAVMFGPGH